MKRLFALAACLAGALLLAATPVQAQQKLRIGFIATFTGPGGILGEHMRKGAQLALDEGGGKVGGLNAEIIFRDDQTKPDIGRQVAVELVERENVAFLSGIIWSNVMVAVAPYVAGKNVVLVGAVGGPQELAGEGCARNIFVVSNQTAQGGEAMGAYFAKKNIGNVYLMAPNYAAGRDIIEGFKRSYKGQIVSDVRTKLGQMDYQAELTNLRTTAPAAVAVFYPGGMGVQFVNQFAQSGLRGNIPLYGIFTSDHITLPGQKTNALGNYDIAFWNHDLTNERNRRFVQRFREKYGHLPGLYAATSYDAIKLIDHAVRAVGGKLENRDAMITAMEKARAADFGSVRDTFYFNSNHFPIQNFYLLEIKETPEYGIVPVIKETILAEARDAYFQQCKMPSR